MIEAYVFAAIALVAAGMVLVTPAVVSLGMRRDDHRDGFPAGTNDRIARSARRITGAGSR